MTINRTISTKLVLSPDGIPYRLVLWGFYNNGTADNCPSEPPAGAKQVNTFITKESSTTYGCLYGSFNQERYVTIAKKVTADANSSGVTIPEFSFSTDAQAGADSVSGGTPDSTIITRLTPPSTVSGFVADGSFNNTLKPSRLGETDLHDSRNGTRTTNPVDYRAFLVGRGDFTISENIPTPSSNGGTRSGWDLTNVSCVNGKGDDVAVTHTSRGVSFENVGVAEDAKAVPITCTFHNHYTAKSTLTLQKELRGNVPAGVTAGQWTLSARGVDQVTSATAVTGLHGRTAVTRVSVPSGTYGLTEIENPDGVAGFRRIELSCRDNNTGRPVAVRSGDEITLADGADVTCTFVNEYKTASITLTKILDDPDRGYAASMLANTFPLTYDCGYFNGKQQRGTVWLAPGASRRIDGLPVGIRCSVSEQKPTGNLKDSSYSWAEPVASPPVTTDTNTVPTLTVTNKILHETADLTITKQVRPEDGVAPGYTGASDRTFAINYSCRLDGNTAEGKVELANGASRTVPVSRGAECSVWENADQLTKRTGDFKAPYYEWTTSTDRQTVVVDGSGDETVTVTNKYTIARVPVSLTKHVWGPNGEQGVAAGYIGTTADQFNVTVTCDEEQHVYSIPDDGTWTVDLPRGADCRLHEETETENNFNENRLAPDYDWSPEETSYRIDRGPGHENDALSDGVFNVGTTPLKLIVDNYTKRAYGAIAVAKNVTSVSGGGLSANEKFTFTVSCDAPARGEDKPYTQTVTIGNGQAWRSTDRMVPAGTVCTVTEEDLLGTSTHLTDSTFAWTKVTWDISHGVENNGKTGTGSSATVIAHAASADTEHPYPRVTFTNTYERKKAHLSIKKMLSLPQGETIDEHTYAGTFFCRLGKDQDITGTWSQRRDGTTADAGNVSITIASDTQGLNTVGPDTDGIIDLYAGSWCTVGENTITAVPAAHDGHLIWGAVTYDPGNISFASGQPLNQTVIVTNHVDRTEANVLISKSVKGGTAGVQYTEDQEFPFEYTCWTDATKQEQVATGTRSINAGAPAADLTGTTLAAGTYCEIHEKLGEQDGLKDPWIWEKPIFTASGGALTPLTGREDWYSFIVPGDGQKLVINATNALNNKLVTVRVSKEITGETQGYTGKNGDVDQTFTFQLTCASDDPSVAGYSGPLTVTVPKGSTPETAVAEATNVPVGQRCTVTETTPTGGLIDASYAWGDYTTRAITSQDGDITTRVIATRGDSPAELRVTNTITRAYGTIDLTKRITGQDAVITVDGLTYTDASARQGRNITYTGRFQCTHEGDDTVYGRWQVTGPGDAEVWQVDAQGENVLVNGERVDLSTTNSSLLLDASCTATEDRLTEPPNASDPSYTWGKAGATAVVTPATVVADKTARMDVANEVLHSDVRAAITKVFTGPIDGLKDPEQLFTINASCRAPQGTGSENRSIAVKIDQANASFSRPIPVGWECVLSEGSLQASDLVDSSYRWLDPVFSVTSDGQALEMRGEKKDTFTVPQNSKDLTITVTNNVERVYASVELTKVLAGESGQQGMVSEGTEFSGTYVCSYNGAENARGTWTVAGTGKAILTNALTGQEQERLPLGTSCTAEETAVNATPETPDSATAVTRTSTGLRNVSWAWAAPQVSYDRNRDAALLTTEGVPANITVTNSVARVYTSLRILKDYPADPAALALGAEVTINWRCTDPDVLGRRDDGTEIRAEYSGSQTLAASGGDSGPITQTVDGRKIPASSRCRITENTLESALLSDSSWKWREPTYEVAEVGADGAETYTTVTGNWHRFTAVNKTLKMKVVNTTERQWGHLDITKVVPDETTTEANRYGGTWKCVYTPVTGDPIIQTGTWSRSGSGAATVISDEDYNLDGRRDGSILVGSVCTATEESRPDNPTQGDVSYRWATSMDGVPVEATANEAVDAHGAKISGASRVASPASNAALSITNDAERHYGSLYLAKDPIQGATDGVDPNGHYKVAYTCQAGNDQPIIGYVFVIAGGEAQRIDNIPLGSRCLVQEVIPGSAPDAPINLLDTDKFQWNSQIVYRAGDVIVEKDGEDTPTSNHLVFTLPGTTGTVDVINTVDPIAQVNKTFNETTQHLGDDGAWDGTWDVRYTITVENPSTKASLRYALKDTPSVPTGHTITSMTVTGPSGRPIDVSGQGLASGSPVTVVPDIVLPDGAVLKQGTEDTYVYVENGEQKEYTDPRTLLGPKDGENGTHTYTVTLNITANANGTAVVTPEADACQAITPGDTVTTIHNQADVTSNKQTRSSEDCGGIPESPTFTVTKDNAGDGTAVRNGDTYTATYTVTVENTSTTTSKIFEDLTDQITFPETATVTGATYSEKQADGTAADPVTLDIAGGKPGKWTLARAGSEPPLAGGTRGADGVVTGGGTRVFTVTVTFTVDSSSTSPAFSEEEYVCGSTRADGTTPRGLYNLASLEKNGKTSSKDDACQNLTPDLKVKKEVHSNGGTSGAPTFDVVFKITATNEGNLAQSTGVLTDTPGFATGLTINSAKIADTEEGLATASEASAVNGAYTLTDGVIVEPGQSKEFFISFNVTLNTTVNGYDGAKLACETTPDGKKTAGSGLFNAVAADAARDTDGTDNNVDCAPVGPRTILVKKTGTQPNGGEPNPDGSYPLSGAEFAIYDANPQAAEFDGRAPIQAFTQDGDGSLTEFTTATLELGKEYWLVETKAPAGHNLMPRPVHFALGTTDDDAKLTTITLIDPAQNGLAPITVTNASGGDTPAMASITVKDTQIGVLPRSGGAGISPYAWAAMLLTAGAMVISTIAMRRRREVRARY
ncbi:DUF5979 domain-containing protein [Actinomyces sp. B33]|uniref:DUF5979 domain-containing protein n=1 Tax=Actinomyces sp. B33 TaxID=2942131 RepID=UPI002341B910|nr:DUF5979 domain-containing protein [Actinomyces sp. B33]